MQDKQLEPPLYWKRFEDLCHRLWMLEWRCQTIQKNGRQGQQQRGVDIFGIPDGKRRYYGIQCKCKSTWRGKFSPILTAEDIDQEVEVAEGFRQKLQNLIIATTAPADAKLQEYTRELSQRRKKKRLFTVDLFFWPEIAARIFQHERILEEFYPERSLGWKTIRAQVAETNSSVRGLELQIKDILDAVSRPDIYAGREARDHRSRKSSMAETSSERPAEHALFHVDITKLPETGYKELVGREREIARLDKAWADSDANIISLIAEAGIGKSALVHQWLSQMRMDGYRGARITLGWSFYNQGTKERATSAEEFLTWAVEKLGIRPLNNSPTEKAHAIAEAMVERRVLLVLDGAEPLQHGVGGQVGVLKDLGLRTLLRRFASMPTRPEHSLILLTSRLPVADIRSWENTSAPIVDVNQLSEEAGATLLRENGVVGPEAELRTAARELRGHPLALNLLAGLLREKRNGDILQRDCVRGLLSDAETPDYDHATRVMQSIEKEWLNEQPELLTILFQVGLFDRRATGRCLSALRSEGAIVKPTYLIISNADVHWHRCVARLREARLLSPRDPTDVDALDAHPLVREWFGERFRQENETAWRAAHGRLFDHLCRSTHEGEAPKLPALAPLFQAIAHGTYAGRAWEALNLVYKERICRRLKNGELEYYASKRLNALNTELAAISWFFEVPYERPLDPFSRPDQAWLLERAAFCLRGQGRLKEAIVSGRAGLQLRVAASQWAHAAITAGNISEAELFAGDVDAAIAASVQALEYARQAKASSELARAHSIHAKALLAAGKHVDAKRSFKSSEVAQGGTLHSSASFWFSDCLLDSGKYQDVRSRSLRAIAVAKQHDYGLDLALNALALSRAFYLEVLTSIRKGSKRPRAVRELGPIERNFFLGPADTAVDALRVAGQATDLPPGLIHRAAVRRTLGEWAGAEADLDEALEIARQAPMRLYLCDCALERARLAWARIEAFAPLRRIIPYATTSLRPPDENQRMNLREEGEKEVILAARYVATCGYHRRDAEVSELEAVVKGERSFASLPDRA
jgi:tetratricopeptide (TPR) repeat protein